MLFPAPVSPVKGSAQAQLCQVLPCLIVNETRLRVHSGIMILTPDGVRC